MNREIKYRAWDIEAKEYCYDAEHTYDFFCSGRGCYAPSFGEVLDHPDRFIVEQYTGLKDKNGKKIYEGDIVSFDNKICIIIWRDEFAEFGIKWICCGVEDNLTLNLCYATSYEVIGNIHENPELLGK